MCFAKKITLFYTQAELKDGRGLFSLQTNGFHQSTFKLKDTPKKKTRSVTFPSTKRRC